MLQHLYAQSSAARLDPISGLPDRGQFAADLGVLASQYPGEPRTLVLIDAVDMKWAHDMTLAMGLAPFEAIIRCTAQRLAEQLELMGPLYHIGVKRFAFVMAQGGDDFAGFIEGLVELLRQPALLDNLPVRPTVRAGSVNFNLEPQVLDDVVRKAMYASELALLGGQRWAAYDPVRDAAYRRSFYLAADIGAALAEGQLSLRFQPRFAIADGAQVSAEVLLRWQHPRLGRVSPAEFIPVLERNGMIHEVTRWVIDTALGKLAKWQGQTFSQLSINLSPMDFDGHDVSGTLRRLCHVHGIEPQRLEVEITEGEWLRSNTRVLNELGQIRALGVDVAIDDFGSGYSNFSYLHEIPANVVKLDQSMVIGIEENPRYQKIARSIIKLARELGYRTVAEGVETFRCLQLIREYGCDEAQGYFFARPMDEAQFLSWSECGEFPLA
ncbi:GAF domain/cyclic diguanylate phosphodiesterase (EAL) domain-containing protein [Pseudomonas sp. M47T1]|uniref:putative bifunctional diguanylate cyclase/phosphodiesterase n=1 Tax=unclassified Pseudomonas TaxID=196821 RepID=UPI0002607608|nr:GGDEF domain-containing phosphodiesterase [Pseudomonas sp. M47T1]EIK94588.1 GAF domain/cyclic diguanylate phosphodiesterase (EAL) domain-containing protein [Pseudomonas sp. M47T1]